MINVYFKVPIDVVEFLINNINYTYMGYRLKCTILIVYYSFSYKKYYYHYVYSRYLKNNKYIWKPILFKYSMANTFTQQQLGTRKKMLFSYIDTKI